MPVTIPGTTTPIKTTGDDAREIFDLLATEVYYGYNLRCVLSESSDEERAAIRAFCERAKAGREG